MGRVLILFDVWDVHSSGPIGLDRAMLLDFASQHPRPFAKIIPHLSRVLRAHHLYEKDLTDLFVVRQFDVLRERFGAVISDLLARDLVQEQNIESATESTMLSLTPAGVAAAGQFSTTLSLSFRAIDDALCTHWKRASVKELTRIIREALPEQARLIAELSVEMPSWLSEE